MFILLSYRHAFHAGNFADVLKHSVLTQVLDYMIRKEKGFTYIDSHAGAGLYKLSDEYAQKTGEYKSGIAKLFNATDLPEELAFYVALIKSINNYKTINDTLNLYPGSPGIAKQILRRQDSAHLFDLHPTDFDLLTKFCQRWKKSFVKQGDGYQGVLALLPPPSRRAVILIDPSYELKDDYQKAVKTVVSAYQKFATGTYILWYPVVKRELVTKMQQDFINSKMKNVLQVELCLSADNDDYGMTGTGLFIVNPPWQLAEHMQLILSYLQQKLGTGNTTYLNQQLIAE